LSKTVDCGAFEAANEEVRIMAVLKTGKGLNTKHYYINTIPLRIQTEGKHSPYLKATLHDTLHLLDFVDIVTSNYTIHNKMAAICNTRSSNRLVSRGLVDWQYI